VKELSFISACYKTIVLDIVLTGYLIPVVC